MTEQIASPGAPRTCACTEHHGPAKIPSQRTWSPSLVAQAVFIAAAGLAVVLFNDSPIFETLAIVFVSIVLEAFPFLLIGALIGGLVEVFLPSDRISRFCSGRGLSAIFLAGAAGFLFPVCECAVVPVARRLMGKGLPPAAAVAFLLGSPIVNPLVALSTATAYGFHWEAAFLRVAFGYIIAVSVALLFHLFMDPKASVLPIGTPENGFPVIHAAPACGCGHDHAHGCGHDHAHDKGGRWVAALSHAADDFINIARFLVAGAFFAGLLQAVVPRQAMAAAAGSPALSVLAMMALAVLLNLCSEADAFVAASFASTGIGMPAQMAFMVLGPMVDVKLFLMYLTVFQKRAVIFILGGATILVFIAMLAMGMVAP